MTSEEKKLTERQWDLICFCEEYWHEHRGFPSNDDIKESVPGFDSLEEVEAELFFPAVRLRLINRGIDYSKAVEPSKNPSRLSDKQIAVINTIVNPYDKRPLTKKLLELGVVPATYYGWKKQKRFNDYMRARSEELFGDAMPEVHQSLVDRATSGDIRAAKLFYEISGRHTGVDKTEVANMRLLLVRLIEVLQRYLTDDQMRNVAREISSLTGPIIGGPPVAGEVIYGSDSEIAAL